MKMKTGPKQPSMLAVVAKTVVALVAFAISVEMLMRAL